MNVEPVRVADLIGAITAIVYMALVIALLAARIAGKPELGQWVGLVSISAILPLAYLLAAGLRADRPLIYLAWIGLMLVFLLFELIVDHIFKVDFRSNVRTAIPYVMFFFAATGGLLGVAAQGGKQWKYMAIAIYLVMAAMAFIARAKTGL